MNGPPNEQPFTAKANSGTSEPSLKPIPDPSSLTDTAIRRTIDQYRRDLDAMRQLLSERLAFESASTAHAIEAESEARVQAVEALSRLTETRLDGMAAALDGAIHSITDLTEQSRTDRHAQIAQARELIETRLAGMDKATDLVAGNVGQIPAAIDRAVSSLRELLGERIDGMDTATKLLAGNVSSIAADIDKAAQALKGIIDTRLAGMDEATKLLASNVDKVPYAILQEAGNLKALLLGKIEDVSHTSDEKFKAVDALFASNALALTAALAAQEKAVAEQNKSNTLAITKSEVSTKETIAANAAQTQTGQRSLEQTLADLKERVVRIESSGVGAASVTGSPYEAAVFQQSEIAAKAAAQRAITATAIAVIAVIASVISVILVITKH